MAELKYDQCEYYVNGLVIYIIRVWRHDEQLEALQEEHSGSSSNSSDAEPELKPFVLVVQVLKQIIFRLGKNLNQFRYACSKRDALKVEASKAELQVFRLMSVVNASTSKAFLMPASHMLNVLDELQLSQEQWARIVVEQPVQLALGYEALRKSVEDSKVKVVMLPESPLELPWLPTTDMLELASFTLPKAKLQELGSLRLKKQLEGFESWATKPGVQLSREGGPVQFEQHEKHVLRYLGFAHTVMNVPLDMGYLANGRLLSQYMIFLHSRAELRAEASTAQHKYKAICSALNNLLKLFKWLGVSEEDHLKASQLEQFTSQVHTCKKQLSSQTAKSSLDTGHMIATGTALPFEELLVKCGTFAKEVLACCEKPEDWDLALALGVRDAVMCQLLVGLPGQRGLALHALQVVSSIEELFDRGGNYALLGVDQETWCLKWNHHKNEKTTELGTILLEKDALLSLLLTQFAGWAQECILMEQLSCPDLELTQGRMFLNTKGAPVQPASFYQRVVKVLQGVCCNPQLQLGVNVVRHLCADFIEGEAMFEGGKQGLSMLAGHTHETAQRSYLSQAARSASKSATLTKSAALYNMAAKKLMQEAPVAPGGLVELSGDVAEGHVAPCWPEATPMRATATVKRPQATGPQATGAQKATQGAGPMSPARARDGQPLFKKAKHNSPNKQGRPSTLHLLPGVEYLKPDEAGLLNFGEAKAKFMEMYGSMECKSNNIRWVFQKLTGIQMQ